MAAIKHCGTTALQHWKEREGKTVALRHHTVPAEAAYQIWHVTKILSMGKVHTHISEDTQKRFKIKPWEIFEKIHL